MKKIISLLLTILMITSVVIIPASAVGSSTVTVSTTEDFLNALDDTAINEIIVRGGVYRFNDSINIKNRTSELTIKAYSGETVKFTNAVELTGWSTCKVNGIDAFVTDAGGIEIPTLFSDNKDVHITRLPETGYYYIDKADTTDYEGEDDDVRCKAFFADDLTYEPSNAKNVTVNVLHSWVNDMLSMVSYDKSTGHVLMNKYCGRPIETDDRYFLENVYESLDKSGEWCYDTDKDLIYYIPYAGETVDNVELYVSDNAEFINIDNSRNITFEKIKIADTSWTYSDEKYLNTDIHQRTMGYSAASYQGGNDVCGAVTVTYSENINFKNCEFENIGCTAIRFFDGAKHCSAENCYFYNIGSSALFIGGKFNFDEDAVNNSKDYAEDITVKNCIINKYGQRFSGSCGIILTYCDTADISNNEIHDGYYTGISVGYTWLFLDNPTENISVKDNLIYDIGNHCLSDLGGIYLLGVQKGTVVSGNVIHDVTMYDGPTGYAGCGIYLDSGCQFMTVEKNLVFNCDTSGFNTTLSKQNVIKNNIFALCGESTASLGLENYADVFTDLNNVYNNNILLTDNHVLSIEYLRDKEHFSGNGNVIWDLTYGSDTYYALTSSDGDILSKDLAVKKNALESAVFINPGFSNAANFDFGFSSDSKITSTGFEIFDYSMAGTKFNSVIGIKHRGGLTLYNSSADKCATKPSELTFWSKIGTFFTDIIAKIKNIIKNVFGLTTEQENEVVATTTIKSRKGTKNTDEIASLLENVKLHTPNYTVDSSRKPFEDDDRIQAIFFDGEKYNGKNTKVFAYIGYPENASASNKVPAVVLVHGGGVYAQADWVQYWVDRGYAAIAIDGMAHQHKVGYYVSSNGIEDWEDNPNGHAAYSDLKDLDKDYTEQWFYHFVSDIILANNLLRADDKVNSNLIGVAGISWGGFATSVTIGYDNRFAFAIPIYGTGFADESKSSAVNSIYNSTTKETWEPSLRYDKVEMPVMFLNGNDDPFFSADITNASAYYVKNGNLTLYTDISHGYFKFEESIRFANEITGIGTGNIHILSTKESDGKIKVTYTAPSDISNLKLKIVYRTTPIEYENMKLVNSWEEVSGMLYDGNGSVELPEDATMYYIKVEGTTGNIFNSKSVCATTGIISVD